MLVSVWETNRESIAAKRQILSFILGGNSLFGAMRTMPTDEPTP